MISVAVTRFTGLAMKMTRSYDPLEPSKSAQRAAKTAADSPHALINLGRLVRSLEEKSADDLNIEADADESGWRALELKKDMEVTLRSGWRSVRADTPSL